MRHGAGAETTQRPAWSRRAGVSAFKASVRQWASTIGVEPRQVQVQPMTRKWASCSSSRRLCFSLGLLQEDPSFQDVVIVHELLHLAVPNHGRLFKSLMTAYLPAWEHVVAARAAPICASSR